MLDVTFGTNTEGRPLAVSVGVNGRMKSFTPLRCFMPSQCQWVFAWILGTAMPKLFGRDTLRRMQLFLTDGDAKIYHAFDQFQKELYPNAKHGLCIYHLVTKGLEKIKNKLRALDTDEVQDVMHTFKNWVFSWMCLGGVESEEEFEVSKNLLTKWLKDTHDLEPSDAMKHNALTLDVFLRKGILEHKHRWFFPDKKFHLTLNQKATSRVESVNQTMKYKASKIVKPNMTMLESLQAQDAQCKARMDLHNRSVMQELKETPLWASSPTSGKVSTICESQIQQSNMEASNYLCKAVSYTDIWVVRKPNITPVFCNDCSSSKVCEKCVPNSPIACFKRKRIIRLPHSLAVARGLWQRLWEKGS